MDLGNGFRGVGTAREFFIAWIFQDGSRVSLAISAIKLLVQPTIVWILARLIGLPPMETQVVVLLASIAVGANVYLMSRQFKVLEGPVAGSLVLSTIFAALTTPLLLTLTHP